MKYFLKTNILLIFAFSLVLFACKKDENPIPQPPDQPQPGTFGKLQLSFEHLFKAAPFNLGTAYVTDANDTLSFTTFNYYVTNVVLIDTDNKQHSINNSYFLVKHDQLASRNILIDSVPSGIYKGIQFMLAVDSVRNQSGAQTGALDPAQGMFWSWNTGYIFIKAEGTLANGNNFRKHIGGFKAPNNAIRTVELGFNSQQMVVTPTIGRKIHFTADVNKMFSLPNTIIMSQTPNTHMPGERAMRIADNAVGMFKVDHIH